MLGLYYSEIVDEGSKPKKNENIIKCYYDLCTIYLEYIRLICKKN